MLVERLTFRAKYGQGDRLVELFKQFLAANPQMTASGASRLYTDATGPMFTVQVEQEFAGWNEYAGFMTQENAMYATPEFQQWFADMTACTESGERQILTVQTP